MTALMSQLRNPWRSAQRKRGSALPQEIDRPYRRTHKLGGFHAQMLVAAYRAWVARVCRGFTGDAASSAIELRLLQNARRADLSGEACGPRALLCLPRTWGG